MSDNETEDDKQSSQGSLEEDEPIERTSCIDTLRNLPSECGNYFQAFCKGFWNRIQLTWKGIDVWDKAARKPFLQTVRSACIGTTLVVSVMIITSFLFYGFLWDPPDYYDQLDFLIVNQDGAEIGNDVVATFLAKGPFDFDVQTGHGYEHTSDATDSGDYWASIFIPPGYTAALNATLYGNYTTFTQRIFYFYDEGRHLTTHNAIKGIVRGLLQGVNLRYATTLLQRHTQYLTSNGTAGAFLSFPNITDTELIAQPIHTTEVNLHPVDYNGLNFAGHFAYIPLWIMAGATVSMVSVAAIPLIKAGVRPIHIAAYRVCNGISVALLLSLSQALVVLAFGGTFERGFGAYWMWNWMTCFCFGSIIAFIGTLLGPPGQLVGIILLILFISTAGGLNAVELCNDFYKLGYALPMYNAVTGARTILFGSYDIIGRNAGIIIGWFFLFSILTFIAATLRMSRPPTKPKGFIGDMIMLFGGTFGFVDYYSNLQKSELKKMKERTKKVGSRVGTRLSRTRSGGGSETEGEKEGSSTSESD